MAEKLYGINELAKELGWSRQKTAVYYRRGKFPEPFACAGSRAFWTKKQVEECKKILEKRGEE